MGTFRSTDPTAPGFMAWRPVRALNVMPFAWLPRATSVPLNRPGTHDSAVSRVDAEKDAGTQFTWAGEFDRNQLREGFQEQFSDVSNFEPGVMQHLDVLVGFIETDAHVTDIRWMAYMLATVYWETTHLETIAVPRKDAHGKPMHDKQGKLLTRSRHGWFVTMKPVDEVGHGKGRDYHLPVKVETLPKGGARVTEQDGDVFTISPTGTISKPAGARMGSAATGKPSKAYASAAGDEHSYYGRGYVQLTWWSNYLKSSLQLGLGLKLLLEPDEVLKPQVAYDLMAYGMRTGKGFANGHKLSDYFHGAHTDYAGARHMVNGSNHATDIAKLAKKFETILLAAKRHAWSPCVRMAPFFRGGFFSFVLMLALLIWPSARASVPPQLQGTWHVVQVAVDHKDQPHWLYYPDDPRLLGRMLTMGEAGIVLDDGSATCAAPSLAAQPAERLGKLVGDSYPRAPAYQVPPQPALADFGLRVPDQKVSPLRVSCAPKNARWAQRWFVQAGPWLLVGRRGGNHILVLRKVDDDKVVRPSFDCSRAQGVVEHAICRSPELAAYDRSVAAAYGRALKTVGGDGASLRKAQKQWLATRNACGCDDACLLRAMRTRVDQLVQSW